MYDRTLNQILTVLRRIKCLTYVTLLVTLVILLLYLTQDLTAVSITASQTIIPVVYQRDGHGAHNNPNFHAQFCQKPRNIIFTKTHKTGSSTISNILLRYGEVNNLSQLLYSYRTSTEYKKLLARRLITNRQIGNIFAQHATYDMDFLREHVYGSPPPRIFTIIRNPVSQFVSGFSFFEKPKLYPAPTLQSSIQLFLDSHSTYLKDTWFCRNCDRLVNANSLDMGFRFDRYMASDDKNGFVEDFLAEKTGEYELVLITEYFDLSLVLLKRRMCLTYNDIVYLRSLERIRKETVDDSGILARITEIQKIDMKLYEHFNRTFWEEIEKEDGIFEDLRIFQQINSKVQEYCVQGKKIGYMNTYENRLTDAGKENYHCLAMNTRCLPFSTFLQARDDEKVSDETRAGLLEEGLDNPDSLNFRQILTLNRHTDIVKLATGHV